MSIRAMLDDIGLRFEVRGDEAFAPCPAHKPDTHPSWSCNLDTGVHHCFSCGFGGGLALLVSRVVGCSYAEAVAEVAAREGIADAARWLAQHERREPVEVPKFCETELAQFIPPPLSALESRKLTRSAAEEYGILWEPAQKSWILPIRDPYTGELRGWQDKNARRVRNRPKYIQKSSTLFGAGTIADECTAILCESPLDAVRIRSAGLRGGVSSYGVCVSDEQLLLILERCGKLVLALDNDHAGMAETARICREFRRLPVYVFSYQHTAGVKDPGDMTDQEVRQGFEEAKLGALMGY
jgi:DNA primase